DLSMSSDLFTDSLQHIYVTSNCATSDNKVSKPCTCPVWQCKCTHKCHRNAWDLHREFCTICYGDFEKDLSLLRRHCGSYGTPTGTKYITFQNLKKAHFVQIYYADP